MGEPSAPGQRVEEEGSGICWEQNTAPKPLEESPTEGVLVPGLTGALALLQRGFLSAKEKFNRRSRSLLCSTHRNSFQEKSSNNWSCAEVAP